MRSLLPTLTAIFLFLGSASGAEEVWSGTVGGGTPKLWMDDGNWQDGT